jgi:DNA-binding protein YbaB
VPEGISASPDAASSSMSSTVALADRVATLSASAAGDDGAVRVTVAGSGLVTRIELDDRVQRLPGTMLAAELMRTIRRAQAAIVEQAAVAIDETVGIGSETGKAVLDSFSQRFPSQPDKSEEPPVTPVMPTPPFPTFQSTPTLPQQLPGNGFESGRDSRAR